MNITVLATFGAYLVLLLGFGVYLGRKVKTYEDFYIGSRMFGPFLSSMSAVASFMSGYTYTAAPGLGYTQGYGALWYAQGEMGNAYSFGLLGRRLRKTSEQVGAISMPEFYERRYNSPALRVITNIVILIAISMYLVAQWVATGTLLEVTLGIGYVSGLFIGGVIVLTYTLAGGYIAVIFTDTFQGIVMFIGTHILFWAALFSIGGFAGLNEGLAQVDPQLAGPWGPDLMYYGVLAALTPILLIGLGTFGLPHVTVRHLSLKRPGSARPAMLITGLVVFFFTFVYYLTGPIALVSFGPGLDNPEQSGIRLWFEVLPDIAAGVMASAAVAAIQSTASSFLILLTTTIGHDILYRFFMRDTAERTRIRLARILVVVIAAATFVIAISPPGLVFDIVILAYGGLALGFGIPNLFTVFWRRTTKVGVITSMVSSLTTYTAASLASFSLYGLNAFMLGLVVGLVTIVGVSLLTGPPGARDRAIFAEAARYGDVRPGAVVPGSAAVVRETRAALRRLEDRERPEVSADDSPLGWPRYPVTWLPRKGGATP